MSLLVVTHTGILYVSISIMNYYLVPGEILDVHSSLWVFMEAQFSLGVFS